MDHKKVTPRSMSVAEGRSTSTAAKVSLREKVEMLNDGEKPKKRRGRPFGSPKRKIRLIGR